MKKLLSTAIMVIFAVGLFAQPSNSRFDPETFAKDQTKKMKDLVSLTEDQETKVYKINYDFAEKRSEIFQNRTDDREATRSQLKELHDSFDADVKKVLDTDQYIKYLENKEKIWPPRPANRGGGGRGPGRGRNF